MDIYENIVIGNFLYSFGVAMGAYKDAWGLPISVNLLQQTPLDRSAGDVLVRGSLVMRLIEFKRESNDDDKEHSKLIHLQRMLLTREYEDLSPVSREVHWFISSSFANSGMNLRIVPYLDFRSLDVTGVSLTNFIETMVRDATQSGLDRETIFSRYLDMVAKSQGSIKGSSGGMILSVNQEGIVNYMIVEDLRELGLPLRKLHALYIKRQSDRQKEYDALWARTFSEVKVPVRERQREQDQEQGLSR